MSVLIKSNVHLPRSCRDCPFNYSGVCIASANCLKTKSLMKARNPDCPIVEIPTPHGDLVDRDDLIDEINRVTFAERYDYNVAYNIVTDADTIIEAEVSE